MPDAASAHLGSVAVIGGCGFLGHHIVDQLLSEPTVTSISVMSRNPTKNLSSSPLVTYNPGDITSPSDVTTFLLLAKPNVIINTASPIAYLDHLHAPSYSAVNLTGNVILLHAARLQGICRAYIYTSSAPIIAGPRGAYHLADETYPTLVQASSSSCDAYHLAKALGDKLVLSANESSPSGIRTATIRPTAMYGEGDMQMISNLLNVYRTGQQNVWLGDNTCLMDSVYVGNVAHAHILAAKALLNPNNNSCINSRSNPVAGEAFNITDNNPLPPWSFFRQFWIAMGDTTPLSKVWKVPNGVAMAMAECAEWWTWAVSWGKSRPKMLIKERIEFLVCTRTYNIGKARERLGYEPVVGMHEGVRRAVRWAEGMWPMEGGMEKV